VKPEEFILASGSPRRRELLSSGGYRFRVLPAGVDEYEGLDGRSPSEYVIANATLKAGTIADRHPGALVLGADTTVFLDSEILNKPENMVVARRMIQRLAGRAHTVYTGFMLLWKNGDLEAAHAVSSRVIFKPLEPAEIDRYFSVVNPLDKAGAYGIQEGKEIIIDHFEGSFSNIMGLPMEALEATLDRYNFRDLFCNSGV